MSNNGQPRLCFVGPMIGRHPGQIVHQGQILSDLFAGADYSVLSVSSALNRWVRFADITASLIRQRRNVDVVVLEIYGRRSFIVEDVASRIAKRLGLPLVMVLHSGSLPELIARFPKWTGRTFRRADAIVAPTAFLARAVEPLGLKARVIPNVVDVSRLPYRQRRAIRPRLLWMRTFYSHYNPAMAIQVLARLRAETPEATLVMAGRDKGMGPQLKQMTRDLGLDGAVRFPGFLDSVGKVREGEAADIFINTNSVDNAPVAVLEACAMGLPVVATAVGGIRDLLTDGETALLVPDGDVQAMADAVQRLQREPALASRLSRNGYEMVSRSSWSSVRPLWERVFADAQAATFLN